MGKGKLAAEERERLLAELSKWISERLDVGEVPRAQDVVEYARSEERYNVLTQAAIKKDGEASSQLCRELLPAER